MQNKGFGIFCLWRRNMREFNRPRRDFSEREMHKTTCSECGKECEVPFKPAEGKPVYCRDCYSKRRKY